MSIEERLEQVEKDNEALKEKIEFLEFRMELVASKTHVSQLLYENNVNFDQYKMIMDVMDEARKALAKNKEYNHAIFETQFKSIFPEENDNRSEYHFIENITRAFMEDGRWTEVFPALYGEMPKYKD